MNNNLSPIDFYDLPLLKLFLLKNKVKLRCLLDDLWCNFYYKKFFKLTRNLRNSKSGSALIMGNGPRLKDCIEYAKVHDKDALSAEKFCFNDYILHTDILNIIPDYYFMLDCIFFEDDTIDEKNIFKNMKRANTSKKDLINAFKKSKDIKEKVLNTKNIKVFIPVNYYSKYINNDNFYPISGKFSSAVTNYKNITKTLSWPSMTALCAISTAIYLGFTKIYIAGFDWDNFKTVRYDRKSKSIKYNYGYFYQDETSNMEYIKEENSPASMLSLTSCIFRHANKVEFINLDQNSVFV